MVTSIYSFSNSVFLYPSGDEIHHWRGHQTSPTVVSLKGRLPQILQSKSTLCCKIVQKHSLFLHGFVKKPNQNLTEIENRRILFLYDRFKKKTDLGIFFLQMLFEGRYKTQDYFRYFLHLFSVPSFIFSKNWRGAHSCLPSKDSIIIRYLYSEDGFTYGHSIQYKMILLHLHVYRSINPFPHNKN